MKCKALNQSGINLVKTEQDKKPVRVATKNVDGTYSFGEATPMGKRKSILDKKNKPKCTCSAQTMTGFVCPKIGTRKEGGAKECQGSMWRVTPICFTLQKL
jgi:hypothetical protein